MAVKLKERKGKWWVFIDHNGKRKAKCVGKKKAAEKVAEQIAARLTLGDFNLDQPEPVTAPSRPFDVYFQNWLDTYVTAHCKPATHANYETAFRVYLRPHFGSKDITEIARDDVKTLVYAMLDRPKRGKKTQTAEPQADDDVDEKKQAPKTLSRRTVRGMLVPLCAMFNHAGSAGRG